MDIVWREPRRQALSPRFIRGSAAVPTVVIDAHGALVLSSWHVSPNPATADGHNVVSVG